MPTTNSKLPPAPDPPEGYGKENIVSLQSPMNAPSALQVLPTPTALEMSDKKQSSLRYVLLVLATLLSVRILAAGWESLVLVPLGGFVIAAVAGTLALIFHKKQTDIFTAAIAFGIIVISAFSFRINLGVVTDAPESFYWGSIFLGEKMEYFHSPFFGYLAFISILFFFAGAVYFGIKVFSKGSLGKKEGIGLLSIPLLLLVAHFSILATEGKEYLKQQVLKQRSDVYEKTFQNRFVSYIELEKVLDGKCANTADILDKILGEKKSDYDYQCILKVLFNGNEIVLPTEHTITSNRNYPESDPNFLSDQLILTKESNDTGPKINYKEGDIILIIAEISRESDFLVDAPGNKVEPHSTSSSQAINSHTKKVGNSIYTQSSNAELNIYKDKSVAIFYPLNRDSGLNKLHIYLDPRDKKGRYKLLEIAKIKGPFEMPKEILEWQKKVDEVGLYSDSKKIYAN